MDTQAEATSICTKIREINDVCAFVDVIDEMGPKARTETLSRELGAKYKSIQDACEQFDFSDFEEGKASLYTSGNKVTLFVIDSLIGTLAF